MSLLEHTWKYPECKEAHLYASSKHSFFKVQFEHGQKIVQLIICVCLVHINWQFIICLLCLNKLAVYYLSALYK